MKIKHRHQGPEMTPEEEKELTEHINEIAKILDWQTNPEQVETLSKIEETVREQTLQYIVLESVFSSRKSHERRQEELET